MMVSRQASFSRAALPASLSTTSMITAATTSTKSISRHAWDRRMFPFTSLSCCCQCDLFDSNLCDFYSSVLHSFSLALVSLSRSFLCRSRSLEWCVRTWHMINVSSPMNFSFDQMVHDENCKCTLTTIEWRRCLEMNFSCLIFTSRYSFIIYERCSSSLPKRHARWQSSSAINVIHVLTTTAVIHSRFNEPIEQSNVRITVWSSFISTGYQRMRPLFGVAV
jgi:hypothetical protein